MPKNNTLTYRVGQLEKNYEKLDDKIDTLLTNDLPHINASLISLKTRINVMTAINVGAIIVGILVAKALP
jgi:hypothetical protein